VLPKSNGLWVIWWNLWVIKSFENSLTSCYSDTAPVPFIVPLTEITELQLLTIIAQSSVAFTLKVIDAV
jgi:hypothetical protein